jgi:chromosome partitioning protein
MLYFLKITKKMIITVSAYKGGVAKSTTAFHLAAYMQTKADTLLIDGDLNSCTLNWANRGTLPFKVADEKQGVSLSRLYEHIVIDTPAKPNLGELKALAKGCDMMVVPSTPDAIALAATLQMADTLNRFRTNYRVLLTVTPPYPNRAGEEARKMLEAAKVPLFSKSIRRLAVFQQAALEGVPVNMVKDTYAQIAWRSYAEIGKEILG